MKSLRIILGAVGGTLLASLPSLAADMGPIAIHGALSTTGAYSDKYNYMGRTDGKFDFIQEELTLNGAYRFENGLRANAQIYAYDFDHYQALTIDFANLDYSVNEKFGVRLGRNKMPWGLYGDIQDLDQVRIFASLPLYFYPRGTRAISAGFDGLSLYGEIKLGSAGSLGYQVFAGRLPAADRNLPFVRAMGAADNLRINEGYGDALVWNTPIEGLRFSQTAIEFPKTKVLFTGFSLDMHASLYTFSTEYTKGKWSAVAEYQYRAQRPSLNGMKLPTIYEREGYLQVTYQITSDLGLGSYFSYDKTGTTISRDTAIAASYSLTPWCLVKAEVHALNGIGQLGVNGDLNPGAKDAQWNYYVLKTTLSF